MSRESKIGDLLVPVLKRLHLDQAVKEHLAVMVWAEVVGATNARHSWAQRVRQGVLTVGTSSAAWAQELTLLKPDILARLNRRLGEEVIRDIRFSAGRARATTEAEGGTPPSRRDRLPATPEAINLPRETIQKIEHAVQSIADPELKRSLERALIALEKTAEWKTRQGWKTCPRCGHPYPGYRRTCPECGGRKSPPGANSTRSPRAEATG